MKKARMLNSDIKTNEAEVARALAEKDLDAARKDPKSIYWCLACGGTRMAGDGDGTLITTRGFLNPTPNHTALRQTRATWMSRKGKGEVATQCSKCRSVIVPTDEQLIRMDVKKLKDVKEESELRLGSSSSS